MQELRGKLVACHAKLLHTWEHIERTKRLKTLQSHLFERIDQIAAPLIVGLPHHLHVRITVPQGIDRRVL